MPKDKIPLTHPGDILRIGFLEALGMSQSELARRIKVDKRRVNEIVRGERAVTADTAIRLATLFGTTPGFWLNMQTGYEIDLAEEQAEKVQSEIQPYRPEEELS